jgi:hypothetical protein
MNAHTFRVKPRIEPFLFGIPVQLHGKPRKLQVGSIQASTISYSDFRAFEIFLTIISFVEVEGTITVLLMQAVPSAHCLVCLLRQLKIRVISTAE